ncbi:50S ribosomal protein L11 methyltransferase [bacterium]|nr:50S ribosomal protein L11 methyltransferase [bacterium]MDB2656611.1 50S ribosomal protein L11 methyltransferase [Crocinitomicaceae bacterium]MDB3906240.1 50S ribosomal protein L11 methyltransferase [Crocinitomicaceae bacterium]
MDTLEVQITLNPKSPWNEVLVAELADLGFDSFVETENGVIAYGDAALDHQALLQQTSLHNGFDGNFKVETKVIPHQNWNAQWEADFQPVYVEKYASILAPFHDTAEAPGLIVTIQPKMSFGTGHHQTTWMMTKALFELETIPANVLDMGTGTGVLAIVAEKLGANRILAVDIEEWSAENAAENAASNNCTKIESVWGDVDKIPSEPFGLILANINKNVLKAQMPVYSRNLEENGTLLLSGFFETDVKEMEKYCQEHHLVPVKRFQKDEWAAIQLRKSN